MARALLSVNIPPSQFRELGRPTIQPTSTPGQGLAALPWKSRIARLPGNLHDAFLELEGDVAVSAVRLAERSQRLVVRLLNRAPVAAPVRLRLPHSVRRAVVLNQSGQEIGHFERYPDGWLDFAVAPGRLVTLGFEL